VSTSPVGRFFGFLQLYARSEIPKSISLFFLTPHSRTTPGINDRHPPNDIELYSPAVPLKNGSTRNQPPGHCDSGTSHAEITIPTFSGTHSYQNRVQGAAFSTFQVLIADDKVTGDPRRDRGSRTRDEKLTLNKIPIRIADVADDPIQFQKFLFENI